MSDADPDAVLLNGVVIPSLLESGAITHRYDPDANSIGLNIEPLITATWVIAQAAVLTLVDETDRSEADAIALIRAVIDDLSTDDPEHPVA